MELITLTQDNLQKEHVCCAMSDKDCGVAAKKEWLKERLNEGLVFLKCNVRGKCFIEYIPASNAWAPIEADGYMYIDCLWVSGQFKGHGYSTQLLDACIQDSKEKGMKGLCILSSKKKRGFLADSKYLEHKGFIISDSAAPYFDLMYLPFDNFTEKPRFNNSVKQVDLADGLTLYYTSQCPFTAKYVPILEAIAKERNVKMNTIHITTSKQAQDCPCPFTTFSLFYGNELLTHEILSEKKFDAILTSCGL